MPNNVIDQSKDITILEVLDRVLNKGVILTGDIVISVADIDLVYLGVKLMLSSVETMEKLKSGQSLTENYPNN
ncbi:MAG: gas vesicle protein [Bacteroidetes bacterium]|nr:gas vesicle protein [Bacteroidota bacterium]